MYLSNCPKNIVHKNVSVLIMLWRSASIILMNELRIELSAMVILTIMIHVLMKNELLLVSYN